MVESSIFYALAKSRFKCCVTTLAVAHVVYSGTKQPQSAHCICSRKLKTKLIVPLYFGTKMSKFCVRIISFSSLETDSGFDSEDSEIKFDRALSKPWNSLLKALRAIFIYLFIYLFSYLFIYLFIYVFI